MKEPALGSTLLGFMKKINKNAPKAKEAPVNSILNQNSVARKMDSNVFPVSLVNYTLSNSDGKII